MVVDHSFCGGDRIFLYPKYVSTGNLDIAINTITAELSHSNKLDESYHTCDNPISNDLIVAIYTVDNQSTFLAIDYFL